MIEAEVNVLEGRKLRDVDSLQKMEEARKQILTYSLQKEPSPLDILILA